MDQTTYQIADRNDSRKLTEFLCQKGQFLLPLVELITGAEMAVDELIEVTGRAAIEAVLTLSAQEVSGPKHPGKAGGEIAWYGRQQTTIPLAERKLRIEDKDILIVYLDGIQLGQIHVIVALGVDKQGYKHVLGVREGSSENATVVKDLLTDIVSRGLDPTRRRLFVIDGSKALRKAIDEVFGAANPIQRCRNHKIRNVLDYLPKDRQNNVRRAMKAAFLLPAEQGMAKLKKLSEWLAQEYPSAAESLLEGLTEMFTINRLDLPAQLRRCLASTNIIESPNAGIREKTGRVTRWRDGQMALRWTASSLLTLEKRMRRIMGHQQLWILEAKLQDQNQEQGVAKKVKSA